MPDVDSTDADHSIVGPASPARAVWGNIDFVRLLACESISDLGSHVGYLALPLAAALVLQASPGQMAALRGAEYLPRIVVGLVAGVWIDRLRRRPVLIVTNVLRGALLFSVTAAAALGLLRIELLYAVGVVLAGLGVVFGTALVAYIPTLVPPPALVAANGARATSGAATEVVGAGVGGILVQVFGPPLAVALDAASFLVSAAGIALIRAAEPPPPPRVQRRRMDIEVIEGVRTLVGDPILRAFLATAFTANFFYSVIMAIYLLYLTRELALSPGMVGVIFGFGGGVGVLVGSAAASSVARLFGLGRTLVTAHLLFGVMGIPLALAVVYPSIAAQLVFVSEFAGLSVNAIYMVNRVSVEQAVTPPHLRGRVQASRTVAHAISGTLGILLGGVLAERIDMSTAIIVGVLGGFFSFRWLWFSPIWSLSNLSSLAQVE